MYGPSNVRKPSLFCIDLHTTSPTFNYDLLTLNAKVRALGLRMVMCVLKYRAYS